MTAVETNGVVLSLKGAHSIPLLRERRSDVKVTPESLLRKYERTGTFWGIDPSASSGPRAAALTACVAMALLLERGERNE